jgi:hypothetical protein
VPDELFVGYGFDLAEQYRNLPDLHVARSSPSSNKPDVSRRSNAST